MEPVASVADKIKGLAKSGQDFVKGFLRRRDKPARRNPIEILKRLQREAFSDLMKLRDRQDKVERMLSFCNTSKGNPFQETSTRVRGDVDALGAVLMIGSFDQQHCDAVERAGIKGGISSRFTFETAVRETDTLITEFVAASGAVSGSNLSLAKVLYMANITDWFSATAVPVGAQFRDIGTPTSSFNQRKGLTDLSTIGPPLLNQHNDTAIGVTVRKSNVVASMAHSVSGIGAVPFTHGIGHCFSTFGQLVCQLPRGVNLSLSGLHQVLKPGHHFNFEAITIPVSFLKRRRVPDMLVEPSAPPVEANTSQTVSTGCIALKLESELDENTRIGGWIEMKNSNPKDLQWAVNMYDDSEDEFGWGMSVGGRVEGTGSRSSLQAESYLKLNLGKKFSLRPGIAYASDSNARIVALMLRSHWSF